MGEAVAKAVNVYRYRAEREGVELATEIEPDLPRAHIDERAIQLAVINLIDNALKYAPGGRGVGGTRAGAAGENGSDRRPRGRPRARASRPRTASASSSASCAARPRGSPGSGAARPRERHRPGAGEAHRREPRRPGLGRGPTGRARARPAGASFAISIPAGSAPVTAAGGPRRPPARVDSERARYRGAT